MANLREEVEKLTQPPAAYGTFLGTNDDGTVDVFSGGRKMRVSLHPDIDLDDLQRGNEVVLNESLSVILAREGEGSGEVVVLKEVLEDGTARTGVRAGRRGAGGRAVRRPDRGQAPRRRHHPDGVPYRPADREAGPSRGRGARPRGGARRHLRGRGWARRPDRGHHRRGRAPVPVPGALRRAQAARAQGDPALRPTRVRQDADRQGGGQLAGQEGGRGHRQQQRPELLPQHQGARAPQQVRGGDGTPDPTRLPAGPGEVGRRCAGHRLLRRDGFAVPDPGHRHQLGHGVDHRAAAAGRDRRRGDPQGRDRDRSLQPRGPHRPGHPPTRAPRREDPHRAARTRWPRPRSSPAT